jgi:DNA adenine methylase
MSDADHERLIARVLTLKGKCALSGYDSALYAPLEAAGWRKLTFSVTLHMDKVERGETKQSRQEVLWLSPNCDVKEKRRLL